VLQDCPIFQQVATYPLLRIYAVYPLKDGVVWFHDLPHVVTDSPIRNIIPIRAETGLIMISYTDGDDTEFWRHKTGQALEDALETELSRLYPDREIPKPTYVKSHLWPQGCSYWRPGTYDVEKASTAAYNPLPNLYICGECNSVSQAWVESALASAERLSTIL
jgi:monoamine oxidase